MSSGHCVQKKSSQCRWEIYYSHMLVNINEAMALAFHFVRSAVLKECMV